MDEKKPTPEQLDEKLQPHEVQPGEITEMIADFMRRNPDWREILESETERWR